MQANQTQELGVTGPVGSIRKQWQLWGPTMARRPEAASSSEQQLGPKAGIEGVDKAGGSSKGRKIN